MSRGGGRNPLVFFDISIGKVSALKLDKKYALLSSFAALCFKNGNCCTSLIK